VATPSWMVSVLCSSHAIQVERCSNFT
jgi:hypothetical protein